MDEAKAGVGWRMDGRGEGEGLHRRGRGSSAIYI